jgi:hypothetical protein
MRPNTLNRYDLRSLVKPLMYTRSVAHIHWFVEEAIGSAAAVKFLLLLVRDASSSSDQYTVEHPHQPRYIVVVQESDSQGGQQQR